MNRAGIALLTAAHAVDDLYQGVIPALLPFFLLERNYSYLALSGITLAATVLSSLMQPVLGFMTDRYPLYWLAAAGMAIASVGVGLSGLGGSYELTWLAVALSGLGVAAFHPEAARAAKVASGRSVTGMSWFTVGGNIGFALAPVLATPLLLAGGLGVTPFLAIPALLAAPVLLMLQRRLMANAKASSSSHKAPSPGTDDWGAFGWLTGMVISRSILFFSLSSFLALYVIRYLGADTPVGSAVLTVFLSIGSVSTLLGGWLADRFGRLPALRTGYVIALPALLILLIANSIPLAFVSAAILGVAVYMPMGIQVMLGQEYLPTRVGTASGVTLGIAVSAGGGFSPVLGFLADNFGLHAALTVLVGLPLIALTCSTRLHDPSRVSRWRAAPLAEG